MSQTVPVTDSGFVDDLPGRLGSRTASGGHRRVSTVFMAWLGGVLGLVAFAAWGWTVRVHSDDVAAWQALVARIAIMDRTLTPLGHGEIPPCRDDAAGLVTRTYPRSNGPRAADVIRYLEQDGWRRQPAEAPALSRLTRTDHGHLMTVEVVAASDDSIVDSLSARSEASALGCLAD